MNIERVELGTVSSGTLRPQDLAAAFLSHAQWLEIELDEELVRDAEAVIDDSFTGDGAEVLIALGDLIDESLPNFLRFGTHEGDGADWGIWGDDRYSDELVEALLDVEKAKEGDSNDNEIAALTLALDLALEQISWG